MAFRQLPYEDSETKYDTCAVVSNSGRLLKYEHGEEIDKAQAVFRINYPPTEGYEKHVGSRTTFDIVNGHHAQRLGLVPAERLRFLDPKYCDQARREERVIYSHPPTCAQAAAVLPARPAALCPPTLCSEPLISSPPPTSVERIFAFFSETAPPYEKEFLTLETTARTVHNTACTPLISQAQSRAPLKSICQSSE